MPRNYKEYYELNKARILAKQAQYRANNREVVLHKKRLKSRERYNQRLHGRMTWREYLVWVASDPVQKKMIARAYGAVARVLRQRRDKPHPVIGCNQAQFRAHLEAQWQPGWTWENYGTVWECDHIRALSTFNLADQNQFAQAAHFTNIRPQSCYLNSRRSIVRTKISPEKSA